MYEWYVKVVASVSWRPLPSYTLKDGETAFVRIHIGDVLMQQASGLEDIMDAVERAARLQGLSFRPWRQSIQGDA